MKVSLETSLIRAKRIREIARKLQKVKSPNPVLLKALHKTYSDEDIKSAMQLLGQAGEGRQ